MNKEFYVGWQDGVPIKTRSFLKKMVIATFIIVPILAIVAVASQRQFNDHKFELGKVKEFSGIYYDKPLPMLKVETGDLPEGTNEYALLVGFGKFGAEGIIEKIKEKHGEIDGERVQLRGTLIYGADKAMIELTEREGSLQKVLERPHMTHKPDRVSNPISLTGEVLDSKCYLGAMKPGEGKIHRSCAALCLSGGVPALFKMINEEGKADYYVLLGSDGKSINQHLIPYVSKNISIMGQMISENGWGFVYGDFHTMELMEEE